MPLITIEGGEGSGKSSLQQTLTTHFLSAGRSVICTREPGATTLGKEIRALLLNKENCKIESKAELLLFAADRAQHIEEVIRPALKRGDLVICDRFSASTIAYQGYGRGLNLETINLLNEIATAGIQPQLMLLLEIDPEEGLKRALLREEALESWNRFEEEELAFHKRVHSGFLEVAKLANYPVCVLDASTSREELSRAAIAAIEKQSL